MYTAKSVQRVGLWVPEVICTLPSSAGEMMLPYTVYKLVLEERPDGEFVSPPMSAEDLALAEVYAEFADEDRELAEMGLVDYARLLREEEAMA